MLIRNFISTRISHVQLTSKIKKIVVNGLETVEKQTTVKGLDLIHWNVTFHPHRLRGSPLILRLTFFPLAVV